MSELEKKIYSINPGYLTIHEEFIRKHSQFGGGSDSEKYGQARTFSSVYEIYVYAFFIGQARGARVEIHPEDKLKTFWELENWKPIDLVSCLLACAIGDSPMDMNKLEGLEGAELSQEVSKLKRTIEEYANGGLAYLRGLFEDDPDLVEDDMLFINLLEEGAIGTR